MYHWHQSKPRSRSNGFKAILRAAYISGAKIRDEVNNVTYDFSHKRVDHTCILAPPGAPSWASDWGQLWNEVERVEHGHNRWSSAQLMREVDIGLPAQMPRQMMINAVEAFAEEAFVARGYVAAIGFHGLDSENPHARIAVTMRCVDEDGWKPKDRLWNSWGNDLRANRKRWADIANRHMRDAGIDFRIDHRSYEDRGIAIIPSSKAGASHKRHDGRDVVAERLRDNDEIARQNGERLAQDPRPLLKLLSESQSTFSDRDLQRACHRYSHGDEQLQALWRSALSSEHVVTLRDKNNKVRYAFREIKKGTQEATASS